jgi:mannose-6-phosphate isomerase class I
MSQKSNFNKYPSIEIKDHSCFVGWKEICNELKIKLDTISKAQKIVVLEIYSGVFENDIKASVEKYLEPDMIINSSDYYKDEAVIRKMTERELGDDPVFGVLSYLKIEDYFRPTAKHDFARILEASETALIVVMGTGACKLVDPDILVYVDMARWEIQQRQRKNEIPNLGVSNQDDPASLKYKWAFFIDWRVCDRLKRQLFDLCDFVIDTNDSSMAKMVSGDTMRAALQKATEQPFELAPFFDPGPWGGQWMKEVCDLDREVENFAWCFNCVPEENSLLFKFGDTLFQIPSINLVFYKPKDLLGENVFSRFGAEFPIRFDFLDTMDGGNLSLQVHPVTDYIQNQFGWHYTQDESYYLMDVGDDAHVYLGLQESVNKDKMIAELKDAQTGKQPFQAEKHVNSWPVKKHDHVLIPAGTVHCSGANSMVLEISSTPYIFTFKLWDWGRMGMDGRPRPVHIDHGKNVIQFNRTTQWTKKNLLNRVETVAEGDGWREERTGLHELEFIETRRHWFSKKVLHDTMGTVNVLNLVEGEEVIIKSPEGKFNSLIVHYAETVVIPAAVGPYQIEPYGSSVGKECATLKAFVRSNVRS